MKEKGRYCPTVIMSNSSITPKVRSNAMGKKDEKTKRVVGGGVGGAIGGGVGAFVGGPIGVVIGAAIGGFLGHKLGSD